MLEESKICPYAGLRPFSEEESLYFKGRDEHIEQATRQLGKNKFLILTGASGDGKSSLVYAGIVPNARAGFLKSTYSNWVVADFKPERNPLYNLCKSIAQQLGIASVDTVKSELSHGFSALVDLYKASTLYFDDHDQAWLEADEQGKAVLKRKAANLLILADQFEEFFTNPENYQKGVPSVEAALVTNLLLETARIALEENLPIYVVITMRSDFIGQCAAFRGLPEYIGFSQFFVPRLNRRQLQEVIEEPARFNGDRISRRLTERLIHDMVEGTDQLPILQHALNQIWKMADSGNEEMDLIHYAMVGGMEGNALPSGDTERFVEWFGHLPEKIRNCYDDPDLQNVLNTHANKLFYQASDYLKEGQVGPVTDGDCKMIIETAFKCLTKIDNGRAVRNRMTLGEITAILNEPRLDFKSVGKVLDIFREPGNTLLKPYIQDDDPESKTLNQDAVLDITHESLIRNWEYLGEWAQEEFNSYSTFLDFEQQLNRWIESGKSNAFLLYIGPLTYFENWFVRCKPNIHWIASYLSEEISKDLKMARAEKILSDAREFLKRSARRHLITRTVMRYGPRRIAAVLGLIGILVFSSFSVKNYLEKRDSYVLAGIKDKTFELANNSKVPLVSRINPVLRELESGQTTVSEILSRITDPVEKINVATGIAAELSMVSTTADIPAPEIRESLVAADSLFDLYSVPPADLPTLNRLLAEVNDLAATLEVRAYYSRDPFVENLREKNANRAGRWVRHILNTQPKGFTATIELNIALEHALDHRGFSDAEIQQLLDLLSPFRNHNLSDWLKKTYDKSQLGGRGFYKIYGPKYNGLYLDLAYLYAAAGDETYTLKCVDTLLYYNENYYQRKLALIMDNATSILPYFYRYDHADKIRSFTRQYSIKSNTSEQEFYARLLARSKVTYVTLLTLEADFKGRPGIHHNTNLDFGSDQQIKFFFDTYRDVISTTLKEVAARNFYTAVSYKDEGIFLARRQDLAGVKRDTLVLKDLFEKAIALFNKVPTDYQNETTHFFDNILPRRLLFVYPDFLSEFHPLEPREQYIYYTSDVFADYILKNDLFDQLIQNDNELRYFQYWIWQSSNARQFDWATGFRKPPVSLLVNLEKSIAKRPAAGNIDLNALYVHLAIMATRLGDTTDAIAWYEKLQAKYIHENLKDNSLLFADFCQAVTMLSVHHRMEKANELVKALPRPVNRATVYAFVARRMAVQKPDDPLLNATLDSCRSEISRDERNEGIPRIGLAYALTLQGRPGNQKEAMQFLKNVGFKTAGLQRMCRAMSYRGSLYEAWKFVPQDISDQTEAEYLGEILYGRLLANPNQAPIWKRMQEGQWLTFDELIFYVD